MQWRARDGNVFLQLYAKDGPDRVEVSRDKGLYNKDVIRCALSGCNNPAVLLDALFPYHQELCRCAEHEGVE